MSDIYRKILRAISQAHSDDNEVRRVILTEDSFDELQSMDLVGTDDTSTEAAISSVGGFDIERGDEDVLYANSYHEHESRYEL
jgi:hypothetical protein